MFYEMKNGILKKIYLGRQTMNRRNVHVAKNKFVRKKRLSGTALFLILWLVSGVFTETMQGHAYAAVNDTVDLSDPRSPAVKAHLNNMPVSNPGHAAGMVEAQEQARKQGIRNQFWVCPDGYERYFNENGDMLRDQLTPDYEHYLDIDGVKLDPSENNINKVLMQYLSHGRRALAFDKSSHVAQLWENGKLLKSYMGTYGAAEGDKQVQGDYKTPVGVFYIYDKHYSGELKGELSLNYPDLGDARRGLEAGILDETTYAQIWNANRNQQKPDGSTRLGGGIEVHGNGTLMDATRGCVAIDDMHSQEIYERMQVGDRVVIVE